MTEPLDPVWLDEHLGPVEILVLALPGATPNGWRSLLAAVDAHAVRVLDLEFVRRTAADAGELLAPEDLPELSLPDLAGASSGLLSEEDVADLLGELAVGETAAVLLVEHLGLLSALQAFSTEGAELRLTGAVGLHELDAAADAADH